VGVSTRELLLVLRARDEASKTLAGAAGSITTMSKASQDAAAKHMAQGKALVTVGAGIAFAGGLGIKYFNDATTAAADYNQKAALTLTQTDKLGTSLDTVKKIGLDVAKTIPVPLDEIQAGLYDIFSSMDVSVPQAKKLLTEFSKAAVAGQTDLQTAGRGTIAILNAWHLPATDVNKVNDIMFKLVQKGVGTYDQFSKSIGRAIPSTVRAGGSIKDLAGMMAFMTRNGLSTAQSATSAARAFDAMANPKTQKHMKDIGLSVKDAHGNFKPMVQIIKELNGKMGEMTAPERAKALDALFKGSGGTIQARRFFDLAIPGYTQLNKLTGDMSKSKGSMQAAYDTMFKQPQSQIQLLQNKYQAMRIEVGDKLLPVKMQLVAAGMKLLDMWNGLSPGMQKTIIIVLAVISVLMVLIGIVMVIVGGILMLMAAAAVAGVALGAVIAVVLGIIAAIVALVIIVVLIVKYHTQIWDFVQKVWHAIIDFLQKMLIYALAFLLTWLLNIVDNFKKNWNQVKSDVSGVWNAIISFFRGLPGRIMGAISSAIASVRTWATNLANGARTAIQNGWNTTLTWLRGLPGRIVGAIPNPGSILVGVGRSIMQGLINGIQGMLGSVRNTLGNVTNILPSWKGPPEKDAKLLYNNGRLVMKGFGDGLDQGVPDIQSKLQGLTKRLPAMIPAQRPVVSAAALAASGDNASGLTQIFNIKTQEIDPRKHAADLGYEVAKRVG